MTELTRTPPNYTYPLTALDLIWSREKLDREQNFTIVTEKGRINATGKRIADELFRNISNRVGDDYAAVISIIRNVEDHLKQNSVGELDKYGVIFRSVKAKATYYQHLHDAALAQTSGGNTNNNAMEIIKAAVAATDHSIYKKVAETQENRLLGDLVAKTGSLNQQTAQALQIHDARILGTLREWAADCVEEKKSGVLAKALLQMLLVGWLVFAPITREDEETKSVATHEITNESKTTRASGGTKNNASEVASPATGKVERDGPPIKNTSSENKSNKNGGSKTELLVNDEFPLNLAENGSRLYFWEVGRRFDKVGLLPGQTINFWSDVAASTRMPDYYYYQGGNLQWVWSVVKKDLQAAGVSVGNDGSITNSASYSIRIHSSINWANAWQDPLVFTHQPSDTFLFSVEKINIDLNANPDIFLPIIDRFEQLPTVDYRGQERGAQIIPAMIILHWTDGDGNLDEARNQLSNTAHFTVGQNGLVGQWLETKQYTVELSNAATGRDHEAINIENTGSNFDQHEPPEVQTQKTVELIYQLMVQYNIPISHIFGHFEQSEFGKPDPGVNYMREVRTLLWLRLQREGKSSLMDVDKTYRGITWTLIPETAQGR